MMVCIIEQARVSADKADTSPVFVLDIFYDLYLVCIMQMSISLWGGAWDYE